MNDEQIKTLAQVRAFLDGTQAVEFYLSGKPDQYRQQQAIPILAGSKSTSDTTGYYRVLPQKRRCTTCTTSGINSSTRL